MNQSEFAEATGASLSTVQRWESGVQHVTARYIKAIERAQDLTPIRQYYLIDPYAKTFSLVDKARAEHPDNAPLYNDKFVVVCVYCPGSLMEWSAPPKGGAAPADTGYPPTVDTRWDPAWGPLPKPGT